MKKYKTSVDETKKKKNDKDVKKKVVFSAKLKHGKLIVRYHCPGYVAFTTLVFKDPSDPFLGKGITDKDAKITLHGLVAMLNEACTPDYPLAKKAPKAMGKAIKLLKHIPLPFWLMKADGERIANEQEIYILRPVKKLKANIATVLEHQVVKDLSKKADKGKFVDKDGKEKQIKTASTKTYTFESDGETLTIEEPSTEEEIKSLAEIQEEQSKEYMARAEKEIDQIVENRLRGVRSALKRFPFDEEYVEEPPKENDDKIEVELAPNALESIDDDTVKI